MWLAQDFMLCYQRNFVTVVETLWAHLAKQVRGQLEGSWLHRRFAKFIQIPAVFLTAWRMTQSELASEVSSCLVHHLLTRWSKRDKKMRDGVCLQGIVTLFDIFLYIYICIYKYYQIMWNVPT